MKQPPREHLFATPFGNFHLRRFPNTGDSSLRAWDTADAYILDYLIENQSELKGTPHYLILNDAFGGLSLPLHNTQPTLLSDSFLANQAIQRNLNENRIDTNSINIRNFSDPPTHLHPIVLIKLPKNLAFLRYQLALLKTICPAQTPVIAAGMTKHMPKSVYQLMSEELDPVDVLLCRKKSRAIVGQIPTTENLSNDVDNQKAALSVNAVLDQHISRYELTEFKLTLVNYPNVFSGQKLDIGTRLLLQHFPDDLNCHTVTDLGCGNGVLGLVAAGFYPEANICFCDESHMAVASAKASALVNFSAERVQRQFTFSFSDGLSGLEDNKADLILCNPPFHQQHSLNSQIALRLFKQSCHHLREDGMLMVVGNRHLNYHLQLKRLFHKVELVASNPKFVLLVARNARK